MLTVVLPAPPFWLIIAMVCTCARMSGSFATIRANTKADKQKIGRETVLDRRGRYASTSATLCRKMSRIHNFGLTEATTRLGKLPVMSHHEFQQLLDALATLSPEQTQRLHRELEIKMVAAAAGRPSADP